MKSAKILLPLLAIIIILVLVFTLKPGADPSVGERASSEDGTAELIDFLGALDANQYAHAAQYVQSDCSGNYCMYEGLTPEEIASELQTLCADHVCQRAELDETGLEGSSNIWAHTVAFLDAEGNREAVCLDADCALKKLTTQFRLQQVDGQFFVVDQPPLQMVR